MLDTVKNNKIGAVLGGIVGAYTIAEFAIKKMNVKNPKGVIAVAVASTVLGVIGGAQIQKMFSGKNTVIPLQKKNPTAKDVENAKNDPMFNPKG